MAQTPSNMLDLGTKAPDFRLRDMISNHTLSYKDIKGKKGTLIIFMCNHCPFVLHVLEEIIRIHNDYRIQGISITGISSNDIKKYPEDAPDRMSEFAYQKGIQFPYLYDETQEVAKAYQAACTPDFYLFDSNDKLVYRGQLDDSRPANGIPVSGSDLRSAIDGILYNRKINPNQKPSIGCSIKWK